MVLVASVLMDLQRLLEGNSSNSWWGGGMSPLGCCEFSVGNRRWRCRPGKVAVGLWWAVFITFCRDFLSAAELPPYHIRMLHVRILSIEQQYKDSKSCCDRFTFFSSLRKGYSCGCVFLTSAVVLAFHVRSSEMSVPRLIGFGDQPHHSRIICRFDYGVGVVGWKAVVFCILLYILHTNVIMW